MVRDYWPAVPKKRWASLHQAILDSNDYLREIIDGHRNTHDDLAALTVSLSACLAGTPTGIDGNPASANDAHDQMPT